MNNAIYLRRRGKIVVSPTQSDTLPLSYVVSVSKNLETLGYGFSDALPRACQKLSLDELTALYRELVPILEKQKGAHQTFKPFYPDFPAQVMEMSEAALYVNALVHYWTNGKWRPADEAKKRLPLVDDVVLKPIELGTVAEFESLFGQIVGSNASLSPQDKEDTAWFVETYQDRIAPLLPEAVPQKENMAYLAGLLLAHTTQAEDFISRFCRTATDVLRLAVAQSGGDVSLAAPTKFKSFPRKERKLLLGLLNQIHQPTEDMLRWKKRWIRLGERLHPGEFQKAYPRANEAFGVLRNDVPFATFNGKLEHALAEKNVGAAVRLLGARAGEFARRLDYLLRLSEAGHEETIAAFAQAADKVSTPVLLQVRHHFLTRSEPAERRVFFPKGNVAKAQAIPNELPPLSPDICESVANGCADTLRARFRALPPLGKTFVSPVLHNYLVPFSQRSASKALRTITRGSRLPLPPGDVLRFFLWWRNGDERTDIDLSATLFDSQFGLLDTISYYNIKSEYGGAHSGDIVDAPDGASEFIDITKSKVLAKNGAYLVMTLNSYTQQPYCDLPECFAGWMARTEPESGEVYDPRTVHDRLDLAADTKIAIPLIVDLLGSRIIWCDLALKSNPRWVNNVAGNLSGIQLMLQSLVELGKPNLYDLLLLHAQARGELVSSESEAETVFSVEAGTPFQLDTLAAEYLQ